jgi:transposase InsO family protein
VREIAARWLRDFKERRPHEALGRITPTVFRERYDTAALSTSGLST